MKEETKEALPLSIVTWFWIAVVSTFEALYEAEFKSVYLKTDKVNLTSHETQRYVKGFCEKFPSIIPFNTTSLFEEGDGDAHDFC